MTCNIALLPNNNSVWKNIRDAYYDAPDSEANGKSIWQWLYVKTGVQCTYVGSGAIVFSSEEDRAMFLLKWS